MVYGLDAILPLEFLLPTLQVAQQLEWNVHELLERLDNLDRLEKTQLRDIAGMYALKHRLKRFYNAKIKTKELQVGELVLAYTLKQHASKIKKQGMEPYVIHDISTIGALCFAILDSK